MTSSSSSPLPAHDADHFATELLRIARAAAEVHLEHFGRLAATDVDFKGRRDLLTVADRQAEEVILEHLAKTFPDHRVVAEESTDGSRPDLADDTFTWFVDPIDGTTNFVHSHPFFAVSLGVFLGSRPVAGCILAPRLDECFLAVEGRGVTLNDRPVRTSSTDELMDAVVATGFAYRVGEISEDNLDHFAHFIPRTRAVRRCGSAALDLAYTACGRYDGFWELHLSPWDVAAGAALVREAGGVVTDFEGGDDWLFGGRILAANAGLHPILRRELAR